MNASALCVSSFLHHKIAVILVEICNVFFKLKFYMQPLCAQLFRFEVYKLGLECQCIGFYLVRITVALVGQNTETEVGSE